MFAVCVLSVVRCFNFWGLRGFGSKGLEAIMPRQARSNLGLWGSIRSSVRSVLLPGGVRLPGVEAARASLGWEPSDDRSSEGSWTVIPVHGSNPTRLGHDSGRSERPVSAVVDPLVSCVHVGMAANLKTPAGSASADGSVEETPCPGTPGVRRRRPLGPVLPNKRAKGSAAEAVRLASSDLCMAQAQSEYQEAIYAPGTLNTKAALRRTWTEVAKARGFDPVPLNPQMIHEVCSALRAAGFRAGTNYLFEARQWHLRSGYEWSEKLELAVKDAKRSLTRGLGPSCKAEEIRYQWLEWLLEVPGDEGISKPEWPSRRREAWVLGFNFLLREIELGCIMVNEVQFDDQSKQVTLMLPASKTDVSAKGCRRTLCCNCPDVNQKGQLCPYHAAKYLVGWQLNATGLPRGDPLVEALPLIGQVVDPFSGVTKEAMIEALKADAKLLVEKVATAHDLDLDRVTGHSLRRSGCKHLARIGVPLELIQYMARHSSQAVLGYVEDALEECPSAATRLSEHLELRDQLAALTRKTNSLESGVKSTAQQVENLARAANIPVDKEMIRKMFDRWARPEVVVNITTRKAHSTEGNNFRNSPNDWVTACGWRWIASGRSAKACLEVNDLPPEISSCDKCKERLPSWFPLD